MKKANIKCATVPKEIEKMISMTHMQQIMGKEFKGERPRIPKLDFTLQSVVHHP